MWESLTTKVNWQISKWALSQVYSNQLPEFFKGNMKWWVSWEPREIFNWSKKWARTFEVWLVPVLNDWENYLNLWVSHFNFKINNLLNDLNNSWNWLLEKISSSIGLMRKLWNYQLNPEINFLSNLSESLRVCTIPALLNTNHQVGKRLPWVFASAEKKGDFTWKNKLDKAGILSQFKDFIRIKKQIENLISFAGNSLCNNVNFSLDLNDKDFNYLSCSENSDIRADSAEHTGQTSALWIEDLYFSNFQIRNKKTVKVNIPIGGIQWNWVHTNLDKAWVDWPSSENWASAENSEELKPLFRICNSLNGFKKDDYESFQRLLAVTIWTYFYSDKFNEVCYLYKTFKADVMKIVLLDSDIRIFFPVIELESWQAKEQWRFDLVDVVSNSLILNNNIKWARQFLSRILSLKWCVITETDLLDISNRDRVIYFLELNSRYVINSLLQIALSNLDEIEKKKPVQLFGLFFLEIKNINNIMYSAAKKWYFLVNNENDEEFIINCWRYSKWETFLASEIISYVKNW